MYLGPGALREVIEGAELYPIQGLFNFKDYFTEIDAYYHQTIGYELGVSTGWRSLNQLYNVSRLLFRNRAMSLASQGNDYFGCILPMDSYYYFGLRLIIGISA